MTEHTTKQFDVDIDQIRSELLRMGGVVQSMVRDAMLVVADGDVAALERVRDNEKLVNKLEVDIDERITNLIALRQPAAVDLRIVLAVSKMLTDMERCGDEAENIARRANRVHEDSKRFMPDLELQHMARVVLAMLNDVMDSFARHDSVKAAEVVRHDKQVDKEWKSAVRGLVSYMIEDPRTISGGIDLLFVARSLERIGDHCKNMSERVIFMVHGADVRHQGVKAAERLVREETQGGDQEG
ncbi:MAG TPA: phosphate signaling complex protein PhoU [Orrella sp.]